MDHEMTCGWEVDRRDRRPVLCGRPAKAQALANLLSDRLVCGVHVRSARALGYEITNLPGPDVRPGQVWADNDHRITTGELPERQVRVVEVDATHATVMVSRRLSPNQNVWDRERRSRIRLDRFRPTSTGYRLVADAPVEG